jgi:hypothetical protein
MASRVYPFPYERRRLTVVIGSATLVMAGALAAGGSVNRELAVAALLLPGLGIVLLRFGCSFDERSMLRMVVSRLRPGAVTP